MKHNRTRTAVRRPARLGFTLTELLIVITILAILSGLSLAALANAAEQARVQRTQAIITKLNQLIMEKWDGYQTRAVPIRIPAGTDPLTAASIRLNALRDLMRMELPERISDLKDPPADVHPNSGTGNKLYLANPSLYNYYIRRATAVATARGQTWTDNVNGWTDASQGAECLYLIISAMRDGDHSALDFFTPDEIGDYDGDGMPEILDAWGRPIEFLRWPSGFVTNPASGKGDVAVTWQTDDPTNRHDPFDPLHRDSTAFAIAPLIMSSGPDQDFDVFTDNKGTLHRYCPATASNTADNNAPDPYAEFTGVNGVKYRPGALMDRDEDGTLTYMDNITNHSLGLGAAQ